MAPPRQRHRPGMKNIMKINMKRNLIQTCLLAAAWLTLATLASLLIIGAASAQTFTVLKIFGSVTNVTGYYPCPQLVQGLDGTLYGTTSAGEIKVVTGTVFKMLPDGSGFTVLKWFTNSVEGMEPS